MSLLPRPFSFRYAGILPLRRWAWQRCWTAFRSSSNSHYASQACIWATEDSATFKTLYLNFCHAASEWGRDLRYSSFYSVFFSDTAIFYIIEIERRNSNPWLAFLDMEAGDRETSQWPVFPSSAFLNVWQPVVDDLHLNLQCCSWSSSWSSHCCCTEHVCISSFLRWMCLW